MPTEDLVPVRDNPPSDACQNLYYTEHCLCHHGSIYKTAENYMQSGNADCIMVVNGIVLWGVPALNHWLWIADLL